jgi:hypothetical protein
VRAFDSSKALPKEKRSTVRSSCGGMESILKGNPC